MLSPSLCMTASLLLLAPPVSAPPVPAEAAAATKLLDKLAGRWVLTGTLGGVPSTHDIEAEWVLKREYLRLHEVSRQKDAGGGPGYEAIVIIGWDPKKNDYACAWLDNTAGGGLSVIARGPRSGDSIPLVFNLSAGHSLHTTLAYEASADTWRMTIDDVDGAKTDRFGDVRLTRAP